MKYAFILIVLVHASIHLIGFLSGYKPTIVQGFSGHTLFPLSRPAFQAIGVLWLVASLLFVFTIGASLLQKNWTVLAAVAIVLSEALIFLYWHDAKWGTAVNLLLAAVTLFAFAHQRFNNAVKNEVVNLFQHPDTTTETVTEESIGGLPKPVQRWLQSSGIVGKEKVRYVRLKQRGWVRTKPAQTAWSEARAEQYFRIADPAFIWRVRLNMMRLLPISGCDKFTHGKGTMQIKLGALINLVNQSGYKIDEGALQRYLAEICWMPSTALSPCIQWQAIDSTSAKALMRYKGITGEVVFHFTPEGDISFCTANRYKGGGANDKKETWQVTTTEYGVRNGIRIPVKSEATWKLPSGDFTWYKLVLTEIQYNEPRLFKDD